MYEEKGPWRKWYASYKSVKSYSGSLDIYVPLCRPIPLRFKPNELSRQVTVQWIPENSNILPKEMTDFVAKRVCSKNGQILSVTYISICARIKQMVKDPPIQHERTAEVYSTYSS